MKLQNGIGRVNAMDIDSERMLIHINGAKGKKGWNKKDSYSSYVAAHFCNTFTGARNGFAIHSGIVRA